MQMLKKKSLQTQFSPILDNFTRYGGHNEKFLYIAGVRDTISPGVLFIQVAFNTKANE
jgi:hypothetical protein